MIKAEKFHGVISIYNNNNSKSGMFKLYY